jgi:XTP/dITP diphosphohydrolase
MVASGNPHKLQEIRAALRLEGIDWVGTDILKDGWKAPREDADSFFGNALIKARAGVEAAGIPCMADDSGLVVPELDGAPGVLSSRYAGESASGQENNRLLMRELDGSADRRAWFECHLVLVDENGEVLAHGEGRVHGRISDGPERGTHGFGYDPLFIPDGHAETFAELGPDVKNTISHRARALADLAVKLARDVGRGKVLDG